MQLRTAEPRGHRLHSFEDLGRLKGISYSRSQLYRLIKAGDFPAPIKLGVNRNAWLESEIDIWIEQRISQREVA